MRQHTRAAPDQRQPDLADAPRPSDILVSDAFSLGYSTLAICDTVAALYVRRSGYL
jgi:hypothetical protein